MKTKNYVPEIQIINTKLGLDIKRKKSKVKRKKIDTTDAIVKMCRKLIPKKVIPVQERVVAIFINADYEAIGFLRVATGSIGSVSFDLRNVFLCGATVRAWGLVFCHNHPTDDVRPSEADLETSLNVHTWCKSLDIRYFDSIILGPKRHFSLDDSGQF